MPTDFRAPVARQLFAVVLACLAGAVHAAGPARVAEPEPPMTRPAYKAAQEEIAAAYRDDRKACVTVRGVARDVCQAEARGKADAAKAQLEARYRPSPDATKKAKNAIAEANYAVAKAKCQAKKGAAQDRCEKQAKLAREAGIRQAKVEKVQETGGAFGKAASRKAEKADKGDKS